MNAKSFPAMMGVTFATILPTPAISLATHHREIGLAGIIDRDREFAVDPSRGRCEPSAQSGIWKVIGVAGMKEYASGDWTPRVSCDKGGRSWQGSLMRQVRQVRQA
jgi:hypothetical protein